MMANRFAVFVIKRESSFSTRIFGGFSFVFLVEICVSAGLNPGEFQSHSLLTPFYNEWLRVIYDSRPPQSV